eukprot:290153-Rhodomonas_salina.1
MLTFAVCFGSKGTLEWTAHQNKVLEAHMQVCKLVLGDVKCIFRLVHLQKRLVLLGVYQWPEGGEERVWSELFRAAQHMLSCVPKWQRWSGRPADVWE